MFGSFVRWLLRLALLFVVFAVLAILAIDLRLADWLLGSGTTAYDALHRVVGYLRDTYSVNRANVDLAIKLIGLAATIVFGGVLPTLWWWRYGEENLPMRLQRHATDLQNDNLSDRKILLAPLSPLNLKGLMPEPAEITTLGRLVRWIGMAAAQRAARRVRVDTQGLDGDALVFGSKHDLCKTERNTIHLLDGLELMAQANALDDGSTEQFAMYEVASREFRSALALKQDDIDALEQASKVAKLLNQSQQVQVDLANLERAATEQKRPTRYARALRFQAEILEERGNKTALKDARLKLETAADALENENGGDERLLELAMIQEQLVGVHSKRLTPTLAEDSLDEAQQLYENLRTPDGRAGDKRVSEFRSQLDAALQAGDEPDDQDDTLLARAIFTHVTCATTPIYREPGGGSEPTVTLEPFTGIRISLADANWPLAEKDGRVLGYVAAADLRRLN